MHAQPSACCMCVPACLAGLFEKREGRVREERDAAQAAAERAQQTCSVVEVQLAEAVARADTLAAELHVRM